MKQLKNTALLCAVLILTGCASRQKEFIALPETVQAQLESTGNPPIYKGVQN